MADPRLDRAEKIALCLALILARLGVNQIAVQPLAGHASSATTAKYYQFADNDMKRDAVAKLMASAG